MAHHSEDEQVFPSTTWAWRKVRIARPPEASEAARAERARFHALPPRDPRAPLTVSIKLRGGAECWVEVRGRGIARRYPGSTSIYDVLRDINRC